MSRILGFLIILGGFAGSYFVYQDYAAKLKDRHNHWADDISDLIREHGAGARPQSAEDPGAASEESFYRILVLMYEAQEHKYSPGDTVKLAVSSAGVRPGEAKMVVDALSENYRIARQLGVFEDLSNTLRMERGEAPVCMAKGWEDEPVGVGHILSPMVAPEAARSLANLLLMPRGVRDMQTDDLEGFTPEMAKKWLSERIITPESELTILNILSTKKY